MNEIRITLKCQNCSCNFVVNRDEGIRKLESMEIMCSRCGDNQIPDEDGNLVDLVGYMRIEGMKQYLVENFKSELEIFLQRYELEYWFQSLVTSFVEVKKDEQR